jgi:hypothetical protein
MASQQGPNPGKAFDNTNGTLRKEIKNGLLDQVTAIADLKRNHDSIATSDNFHLDAKQMTSGQFNGQYKVDVQYRKGTKGTVAQIMLSPNATSLTDAKSGINSSASDGHIWIVS